MDKSDKNTLKHPKEGANCFSRVSFSWLLDIFLLGYKRDLEESDLYVTLAEHRGEILGQQLAKQWNVELEKWNKSKKKQRPRLFRALFRIFGKNFMLLGIVRAFFVLVQKIIDPILLAKVLNYFSPNGTIGKTEVTYWALAMCLNLFVEAVIIHHLVQVFMHIGMKVNIACSSMIYRKVLRLSPSTINESGTTVGQVINLLSNDVGRFDSALIDLHDLWIAPIQLIIITYIIYTDVNWGSLLGMAMLLLCIPFLGLIGKLLSTAIPKSVYKTDDRLRLMNEIIRGIQIIKMYAWEKPFCDIINSSRTKEMKAKKKVNILNRLIISFETYITRICFFTSITAYVYFGNEISGEKVYMMLTYYNSIKSALFISFPLAIQAIINARVSIRRIENFLMLEEIEEHIISDKITNYIPTTVAIYSQNMCAKWNRDAEVETLKNISFNVTFGSMLGIVGQVGSGKSSLLQAMINELPITSGILEVNGKIAYTSQEPWVFSSSIRQNILFGSPFDQKKYETVIRICQLQRDFLFLPYGDKTIIGDRGISLSGGQRARINLARAIYSDAEVYLFDDPLSAVDTQVGRRIFDDCFKNYLQGKTIVLSTHQIQYIKSMDHILYLENGTIAVQGKFEDVLNSDTSFAKYLSKNDSHYMDHNTNKENAENNQDNRKYEDPDNKEMRTHGKMSAKVYAEYFKAAKNMPLLFIIMSLIIISRLAGIAADYLISFWVNDVETATKESILYRNETVIDKNETTINETSTVFNDDNNWYVIWFGSLTFVHVFLNFIVLFLFFELSLRISKNFHMNMFDKIIRATMSFFYSNPSGRIMSRFSKDVQIIDQRLPGSMYEIMEVGINILFIFIIITYVNPIVILPCILMIIILYFLRDFYIKTSRSVKRLEGLVRSPIFDHLSATFNGIATIRAFKVQKKVTEEFDSHQNLRTTLFHIFRCGITAFGMYIDLLATLILAVTVFIFLYVIEGLLPGDVGLILTQMLAMLESIQWGVRISAELENQMVSVERALEYTKVEQEPPFESIAANKPPADWPQFGRIVFVHLCIKYDKTGDRILHHLNFEILPKEKVGIVGRTGAGKTSIIAALFRLAYMEGEIYIDDVPISFLGMHDLRSKISIIPQEPLLFEGTLRKNLDPFEEYKDMELWQALEDVQLKKFVEGLAAGLETKVSEGGLNYSVGQRQLLCLARTILKKNKILVLDEATANVDLITDDLIQRTIRQKFKDCTVLTIAHKLNTIMDSDRVLVMDSGSVVEFDHPYSLLEKKSGYFYNLVQQSGDIMAQILTNIAKSTKDKNS